MDDPAITPEEHRRALRGLARLNQVARSHRALWNPMLDFARQSSHLRVLDLACGAGDNPLALAELARRHAIGISLGVADVSPAAIDLAVAGAERRGVGLETHAIDAVADPLPDGYDVMTSSLFLHHLDDEGAAAVLAKMARAARLGVVLIDLDRCVAGLWAARICCRLLGVSSVVRNDAETSVRAAFTRDELQAIAQRAGLSGAVVDAVFPWRLRLVWKRQ